MIWLTVGKGYNLLVRDGGIRGAVISLERFKRIEERGDGTIFVEAGAENLEVVRFGQKLGLGGIGFLSGIPGSIGGAVRMNAGAYGEAADRAPQQQARHEPNGGAPPGILLLQRALCLLDLDLARIVHRLLTCVQRNTAGGRDAGRGHRAAHARGLGFGPPRDHGILDLENGR